jgi:hypothetical protein
MGMMRLAVIVVGVVVTAAVPAPVAAVRCSEPGFWPHTADAAWTARVIAASGFKWIGCTGSALVIDTGGAGRSGHDLYVWTTRSTMLPRYGRRVMKIEAATIQYDRLRAVWRVRQRNVWIEAGPSTLRLPPLARLHNLIHASTTTR